MEYYTLTTGSKFRHYKGGIYTAITLATHTETGEAMVIYRDEESHIWCRPAEMFFGHLEDGHKRFTLIEEEEE